MNRGRVSGSNLTKEISPKKSNLKAFLVIAVSALFIFGGLMVIFDKPVQNTQPRIVATPSSGSKVTITVWGSGSPGGEANVFNQTLRSFEAAYPNITVTDSPAINVASTTFTSAAHAGTAPDVYRDTSDNAGALYASGSVLNLSSYLNSTYINSFTKGTIADWTLNGALYGIPINTNGVGLYYNSKYVKKVPTTVNQLISCAENITNEHLTANGKPVYGLAYGLGTDSGYRSAAWFPAFGGSMFNSKQLPVLNSQADINAISFLYNLTYSYHVSPKGITSMTEQEQMFEDNQTAFMIDGPWDQALYTSYLGKYLNVTALPYDSSTGHWVRPIWGSVGYMISSPQASGINSHQIWASLKFVEYMTNYTAQKNLFTQAGDFPSLISVGNFVKTDTAVDPLAAGWIAQEAHTQIQPSFVNMNYYWPNFHTYVGNLYDNGTNNVSSTMNAFQNAVMNEINQLNAKPTGLSTLDYEIIAAVVVVIVAAAAAYVVVLKKKNKKQ
jgi:arabinogalactan oligomer/maltooligosaccharide transport system substrate-binding protein